MITSIGVATTGADEGVVRKTLILVCQVCVWAGQNTFITFTSKAICP